MIEAQLCFFQVKRERCIGDDFKSFSNSGNLVSFLILNSVLAYLNLKHFFNKNLENSIFLRNLRLVIF